MQKRVRRRAEKPGSGQKVSVFKRDLKEDTTMKNWIMDFLKDEEGASALEYALVAAMAAVILVAFIPGINGAVDSIFLRIQGALESGAAGGGG